MNDLEKEVHCNKYEGGHYKSSFFAHFSKQFLPYSPPIYMPWFISVKSAIYPYFIVYFAHVESMVFVDFMLRQAHNIGVARGCIPVIKLSD